MSLVPRRKLAAVVALLVVCAWVISLGIDSKSGVSSVDQSVWQFFVDHGSTRLQSLSRFVTSFGVLGVLLPVAVVVGVVVWIRSRSVAASIAPWLSVVVCGQIVAMLKSTTDIARPPFQSQVIQVLNPSFPSGHTANTTALIVSVVLVVWCVVEVSHRTKTLISISGAMVIIAMSLSRLLLNVHWLSDVLAGWCIGAAVGLAVTGLLVAVRPLNFDA
jgi:undecaprenyl-diphosphatase